MPADQIFKNVGAFAKMLHNLRLERRNRVRTGRKVLAPRSALTIAERAKVLSKTASRCHICGGIINGNASWQADHVLAHSSGGQHSADNYLPAHSICNNYRWHYDAEEFQWILKIGVWMRTQIEHQTLIGRDAGQQFCEYEYRRDGRRRSGTNRITESSCAAAGGDSL